MIHMRSDIREYNNMHESLIIPLRKKNKIFFFLVFIGVKWKQIHHLSDFKGQPLIISPWNVMK